MTAWRSGLRWIARLADEVTRRFVHDRGQRVAGALSFTTLLAIVPLTAVALAVLSKFPVFSSWVSWIQHFIYSNFVPAAGEAVQKYLTQFTAKAGRLTTLGLAALAVTAVMLMATVEQVFNDIWRVPASRRLWKRALAYALLLTLGPILIAAGLTVTTDLFTALPFSARPPTTLVRGIVDGVLPLVVEVGVAVLLYVVVPNAPVRWRHALAGALFAAVLLEAARWGFAAAMKYFTTYQAIYGAVAVLPVFLIWIYISWVIVLLGAIVTAVLTDAARG